MLPMIVFRHSIYYGIHFEVFFLLLFSFTYNFLCLFLFYLALVFLNVHPSPAIPPLPPLLRGLSYYQA